MIMITNDWLEKKFNKFNVEYFYGKLNLKYVKVELGNLAPRLRGKINFNYKKLNTIFISKDKKIYTYKKGLSKCFMSIKNYYRFIKPVIIINQKYDGDETYFESVLIHEMTHLYCIANGVDCGHTGMFKDMSKFINEKSKGKYKVTTYFKNNSNEKDSF